MAEKRSRVARPPPNQPTRMDEVADWRFQYALELGFPADDALPLALSNTDLHDVEKLLLAGCRHDLAVKIAWPVHPR